jgi:alpha-L-fucosidase
MSTTCSYHRFLLTVVSVGAMWAARSSVCAEATAAAGPTADQASFSDMHLGLFVHYLYIGGANVGATQRPDGITVRSLDELADSLDVEDLAACAASMRAQYVQFTTWHANMNALYPSKVLQKRLPGHCSRRDVIADLLRALHAKNIRTILYIHPSDGHDFCRADQDRVGWNDKPPYARWNDFMSEAVAEVVDRYGKDVSGYYIDGGLPPQIDPPRLRKTILQRQPKAWLIQNSGLNRACVDYGSMECAQAPWPATSWQRAQLIAKNWVAETDGRASIRPEFAYRYTILQAAVSGRLGGGMALACGPYPGGRWEPGVRNFMKRLGSLVDRAGPSLFNTHPSKAYVTKEGQPLEGSRYVATESRDGKTTYLHVFAPPKDRSLKLPLPVDGRRFSTARLLAGNGPVTLVQTGADVALTLDGASRWDDVDTIIVLE